MGAEMKVQFTASCEHSNITVKYNDDEHADDSGFTLKAHDLGRDGGSVGCTVTDEQLMELSRAIDYILTIKKQYGKR